MVRAGYVLCHAMDMSSSANVYCTYINDCSSSCFLFHLAVYYIRIMSVANLAQCRIAGCCHLANLIA